MREVRCTYAINGCPASMALPDRDVHIASCTYAWVACGCCQDFVLRHQVLLFLISFCVWVARHSIQL